MTQKIKAKPAKKDVKENQNYIYTVMPIWKSVLKMAMPSAILMLVMGAYFFSDTILSINLAGDSYENGVISSTDKVRLYMNGFSPINSLMIALTLLFGMGVATRVAINLGAKRMERALSTIKTGFMVGMSIAIIAIPALMFSAKPWIAHQYDSSISSDVANHAFSYAWIIIMSFPLMMFNQIIPSLLRTEARNKEMLIAMILPIGINLLFDWIMMGPVGMGVEGGAWATFFSYVLTTLLLVVFIIKRKGSLIKFKNLFGFKLQFITLVGVVLVGIAPFLRNFAQSITSTVQMNVIHEVSAHVYRDIVPPSADILAPQIQTALKLGSQQIPNLAVPSEVSHALGLYGSGDVKGAFTEVTQWIKNVSGTNDAYFAVVRKTAQEAYAANFMTLIITGVMPVFMLFFPIMFSFAQSARPIASFNYGAKNFKRVRETFWWTIFYAFVVAVIIYLLVAFALAKPLMDALNVSGAAEEKALVVIKLLMLALPAFAIAIGGMVLFGSTDRIIWSIIAAGLNGLILFWPVVFIMKEAAFHVEWEYFFWLYNPIMALMTSIVILSGSFYVLKHIETKSEKTLDDRINSVYKWAQDRRAKRLAKKRPSA